MATMDFDQNQAGGAVDKSTGDDLAATPVTPKSATLLDASPITPTTPKSGSSSSSSPKQQRRRSEVTSPSPRLLEHIQAEHQYLLNNLHHQDARIHSLLGALSAVQAQLQAQETAQNADGHDLLPLTTAEARRLRKSAGFIQSKVAAAERQEQLLVVRIGEVMAELQGRQWLAQLQQQRQQRQQAWAGHSNGSSTGTGLAVNDPHNYLPLQVPQTPYLAPCDIWAPDQLWPQGHPRLGHHFGHQHQHQHHPTTTTNLILPPSFVVSPVTPGIHATMPASPVSPPALVTSFGGGGGCMSPMSPLAPVFEPGSSFGSTSFFPQMAAQDEGGHGDSAATPTRRPSSSAAQTAALDHVGMHYAYENAATVDDDEGKQDDNDNDNNDSDVSDTAFLPPEARPRRVSHSAARPRQAKQKRMSLPPVRVAWPEEEG